MYLLLSSFLAIIFGPMVVWMFLDLAVLGILDVPRLHYVNKSMLRAPLKIPLYVVRNEVTPVFISFLISVQKTAGEYLLELPH